MCDPFPYRPYEINQCIIDILKILKKYNISVAERCKVRKQIELYLTTQDQLEGKTEEIGPC